MLGCRGLQTQTQVYSVILDVDRGQVYSGSLDNTLRIWDLSSGVCKHTLDRHGSLVAILSISPSYLVSGSVDGPVCVLDLASTSLIQTFNHNDSVTAIQHDDTKIVAGSHGLLRVWDIKSGNMRTLLSDERTMMVFAVAFAGPLCVGVTQKGANSVHVWNFGQEKVASLA
jgi:F-box and WD-40 domain protein CDC4